MSGDNKGHHRGTQPVEQGEELHRRLEEAEQQLKADLAALTRMHALSTKLLKVDEPKPLLQEIMDAAVAITQADAGTLQLIEGDSLRIVAHHGHQHPFLEFFASAESQASVCGEAMKRGQRVVIEDIECSPLFVGTASLTVLREAGVRAVQSTPLRDRQGTLQGILTTQWRIPYVPDEHDLWRIDLLARQAADLIEHRRVEETLRDANEDLRAKAEQLQTANELLESKQSELEEVNEELREREQELTEHANALRESEERYRTLVETAPDALVVHWDGRFLYANGVALSLVGAESFEQLACHRVLDFFRPEERERALERIRLAMAGDKLPIREGRLLRLDGQEVAVELHTGPVDFQGVRAVQTIIRDITERKRAEEALNESRKKYKALIETTSDFIWEMDASGKYTYCSPKMKSLWGYEPQEMIGKTPFDLMPPEDRERVIRTFMSSVKSPGPFAGLEVSSYDSQGRPITLEISGVPFFDADGLLLGYRGVSRDITERKHAEEAIRSVALFPEQNPSPAMRVARDGALLYANPASGSLLEQWGLRTGQTTPAEIHRSVAQAIDTARMTEVEIACGSVIYSFAIAPITSEAYANLYGRDVTARKRTEETLRTKEAELQLVADATPVLLTRISRDLRYVFVNRACAEMLGRRPEEIVGKSVLEIIGKEAFETIRPYVERVLQGERVEYETEIPYPGITPRFMHVTYIPEKDAQGQTVGWLASIQDITEQKKVQEALLEANQKYRALFNNKTVGLSYCRTIFNDHRQPIDYTVLDINATYERLVGIRREQIVGKKITEAFPGVSQDLIDRHNRVAVTGQDSHFEICEPTIDRWFDVNVFSPQTGYFVAIFYNITARMKAEEALRELNATLENKVAQRTTELEHRATQLQKLTLELSQAEDRERKRLAAILHEDLQQHIAAAKFHLGLLGHEVRHDPSQRAIADRVDALLNEAIQKSRGLSHDLSPAVLHMNDIAEVLHWLADRMQAKHGLAVRVDVRGERTLRSEALTMFLFRAVQEMLSNVVKHTEVREAAARVRRMGRYVGLSILDRGCGFDPEDIRETSGYGLLSIRERVELLGGRMTIRTVKGWGSRFHIVVPDTEAPVR